MLLSKISSIWWENSSGLISGIVGVPNPGFTGLLAVVVCPWLARTIFYAGEFSLDESLSLPEFTSIKDQVPMH